MGVLPEGIPLRSNGTMVHSGYQRNRDRSRGDAFCRRHILLLIPGTWHERQPKPEAITSIDGEEAQHPVDPHIFNSII